VITTRITITDDLARAVGRIASKHPNTAVTIAYDDDLPEQEWIVECDAGYGTLAYIVDDQTGARRLAGLGQGIKSRSI
jgi:hypothetical protein